MSGMTYVPGDVAMITAVNRPEPYRAYYDGQTWHMHGHLALCVDSPTSIRPLVVLNLMFPDDFMEGLRKATLPDGYKFLGQLDAADQVEAQIAVQRLPEPGRWGVVKASRGGESRREWVRTTTGWSNGHCIHPWRSLKNPTLIREGVSDAD